MISRILIFICLFTAFVVEAQNTFEPIAPRKKGATEEEPIQRGPKLLEKTEKEASVSEIYSWKINEYNLDTFRLTFDTVFEDFFNYYPIYQKSIANVHLGNLGSPYQSMIYFDRPVDQPFLFMDVYRDYMKMPEDYIYYNTKTPYTSLNYWTGGEKTEAEEQVRVIHSRNIGEDINVTAYADYIYARGIYDRLSTRDLNFSLSGSLIKPKYNLYLVAGLSKMENFENGGFTDDAYITNPISLAGDSRGAKEYNTFQVNLNDARSWLRSRFVYLNHEYKFGYNKDVALEDTLISEFIPVSSFGHSFKITEYAKNYFEGNPSADFYKNNYINNASADPGTQDSTYRRIIENKVKIYFEEGLNKYLPFGFGVYLKNELIRQGNNSWSFIPDSVFDGSLAEAKEKYEGLVVDSATYDYIKGSKDEYYSNTSLGGHLFRHRGKNFFFDANAEIYLLGYRQGDYRLAGEARKWFAALDSASLTVKADFTRTTPDYFLNEYRSNHFWWNNDFDAVFEQRLEGALEIPEWKTIVKLRLNTIINYIYFDTAANPKQYDTALPLLELSLLKNFNVGNFYLDNQLSYQITGNEDVLPLPDLAVHSNLYFKSKAFKVLSLQVGLDARYNTAYYAPAYMPATGRFYAQKEREIGNYPMVHVYANFQLKRMRFFVMYYHVNKDLINPDYFSALHYGYNPRFFKLGVSWNFYD